jgi:hypothetical protein
LTFLWWEKQLRGLKNSSQLCQDDISLYFSKSQHSNPNDYN